MTGAFPCDVIRTPIGQHGATPELQERPTERIPATRCIGVAQGMALLPEAA